MEKKYDRPIGLTLNRDKNWIPKISMKNSEKISCNVETESEYLINRPCRYKHKRY